jgi:hypothetical protein
MELVGNYLSVVEKGELVLMDFRCTNKEIFRDILVPPVLKNISSGLLRIFVGKNPEEEGVGIQDQWILRHVEEME